MNFKSIASIRFKRYAERSSCHGMRTIKITSGIYRCGWIAAVLVACGLLCCQIVTIMETYYSYPVTVSVEVKYGQFDFPAVTVCNLNPYRASMILENRDLAAVVILQPQIYVCDYHLIEFQLKYNYFNGLTKGTIKPPVSPSRERRSEESFEDSSNRQLVENVTTDRESRFVTTPANSNDAQTTCSAAGGKLPFFSTIAEWTTFSNYRKVQLNLTTAWLGIWNYQPHNVTLPGIWRDANGTGSAIAFVNWGGGEPDNSDGTDFCAVSSGSTAIWGDRRCSVSYNYVCMCLCPAVVLTNGVATTPPTVPSLPYTTNFTCNAGHALVGNASIECLPNAVWSGSPPTCVQNGTSTTTVPTTTTTTATPTTTSTTITPTTTTSTTTTPTTTTSTTTTPTTTSSTTTTPTTTSSTTTTPTTTSSTTTTSTTTSSITTISTTTTPTTTPTTTLTAYCPDLAPLANESVNGDPNSLPIPTYSPATMAVGSILTWSCGTNYIVVGSPSNNICNLKSSNTANWSSTVIPTCYSLPQSVVSILQDADVGALSPSDQLSIIQQIVTGTIVNMNATARATLGQSVYVLNPQCTFNGRPCDMQNDFTLQLDPTLGNCYRFNGKFPATYKATKVGREHGLRLVLHANQSDYLYNTESVGFVVTLHKQMATVFAETTGYKVAVGQQLNFALTMQQTYRLGYPYSHCTDSSNGLTFHYSTNYSSDGCLRSCLQSLLIKYCGCGDPRLPLPTGTSSRYCTIMDTIKSTCVYEVSKSTMDQLTGNCSCPEVCTDTVYQPTISQSRYPATAAHLSVAYSCESDVGSASQMNCMEDLRLNDSLINVYIADLTYRVITESPAFPLLQAVSAIGSNLGLFLGMSAITVVEIVHITMEILFLFVGKEVRK